MTHDELVDRAVRWLRNTRGCGVVLAELACGAFMIPDALGWKNGGRLCIHVEVKVSRADFFADAKKPHRRGWTPGNERWYFTPPRLVEPTELPRGWGLAEVHARQVRIVVPAPAHKASARIRGLEAEFLYSALRRHALGAPFDAERGRFATIEEQKHAARALRLVEEAP